MSYKHHLNRLVKHYLDVHYMNQIPLISGQCFREETFFQNMPQISQNHVLFPFDKLI